MKEAVVRVSRETAGSPARDETPAPSGRVVVFPQRSRGRAPARRPEAQPAGYRGAEVRICRPARSATQGAMAKNRQWVIEFEPLAATDIEPLMGWTRSHDPLQQVRLTFPDRDSAVAFAERHGWPYAVSEPDASPVLAARQRPVRQRTAEWPCRAAA